MIEKILLGIFWYNINVEDNKCFVIVLSVFTIISIVLLIGGLIYVNKENK